VVLPDLKSVHSVHSVHAVCTGLPPDEHDWQEFIRESIELYESCGYKKSRQRFAAFPKDKLMDQNMEHEKEEQDHNSRDAHPESVKGFSASIKRTKPQDIRCRIRRYQEKVLFVQLCLHCSTKHLIIL
jgi:hypothetical protein